MADYYSLLARAVSAIPQSTPQMRQAVYERARAALYNQLRAIQPPVADTVIETEGRALDEAIARIEAEAAPKPAEAESAVPPANGEGGGEGETPIEQPSEPQRPAAPLPPPPEQESGSRRVLGILAILIVLVGVVGLAAWRFREQPQDLAKLRPEDQPGESSEGGKFADRIDGQAGDRVVTAPGARPPAPGANTAILPVAQKVELWVGSAQDPSKVEKVYPGAVIWKLDNVAGAPGEAISSAIRGDVEIPDGKFKMSMLIQKNMDATLSASHTIKISFSFASDSELKGAKAIGLIQMRRPEARSGEKIVGIPVSINETNYLIGLMRNDKDQRNVNLMRTLGVLDLPLQFTDGRNATISMEKGPTGERVFGDAIDAWNRK